ncbi:MAG: HypC/HybG/HupF family hydrogenase formation chaperone, partial [bacterium]
MFIMCLGIPGEIEEIKQEDELKRTARVSFGGVKKEINLAYLPEAEPGDYVIVHAGFAISKLDEQEAEETLHYLEEIEEAAAEQS